MQPPDLLFQFLNLFLLFFDRVDENYVKLVIFDAFNFAVFIPEGEQWFNLLDFFRSQADVAASTLPPGEADRPEPVDDVQARKEGPHISLVAETRTA